MDLNLKHELRTPLNHIIGYCELLLEEAGDCESDRLVQDVRSIHRSGQRLLTIVNDLFDAGRQPASHVDRARMNEDVRTMLRDIIGNVEMLQQQLAAAPEPDLKADVGRIGLAARALLRLLVDHLLREDDLPAVGAPRRADIGTFVRRESPSGDRSLRHQSATS